MTVGGTMLGVLLDLIGILFSTSGNLLMRWVANRDKIRVTKDPDYQKPKEYKDPIWYLIVILLFGNGAIDFAAFQFATMTILAPLASVSIVLNSIVAYFLLGEKFTFLHGVGSCIMIVGATLTIISGPPESEHIVTVYTVWDFFTRDEYLIFLGCKAVLIGLCMTYVKFVPTMELELHKTKKQEERDAALAAEVASKHGKVEGAAKSADTVTIHESRDSREVDKPTAKEQDKLKQEPEEPLKKASVSNDSPPQVVTEAVPGGEGEKGKEDGKDPAEPKAERAVEEDSADSHPHHHHAQSSDLLTPCRCAGQRSSSGTGEDEAATPVRKVNRIQKILYTQGHVIIWSFIVSGVGSYTNLTGKIFVKLVAASTSGVQQFTHWGAYLMAVLLAVSAVTQLHLMKLCLARFESIVIMPSLNCMYILHLMCEGGMFFNEFGHFQSELYKGLFALSILIAFAGISVASWVREAPAHSTDREPGAATEMVVLPAPDSPTPVSGTPANTP